nr:reverse transcriptase domain-containing protein [Tanacetum cinerariifolium]
MADQRTMAQLLQALIEGYEDAIVVPTITAYNFELKHVRIWLEKEPPRSIFTWDDLVSKFINQFFPPSKTTNLRNKITNFQQRFDESFSEAWDRLKDLLKACPHHGFSELHQLDTFCNALNSKDQDSLNFAAGAYQAPAYQAPAPQTQGVLKEDFSVYVKANDAVMRNMQTQCQNMQNQFTNLTDLLTNGVSYDGPPIPPSPSFLPKVVENEPEATKDTVNPTNNGCTEDVQPQVVQSESPTLTSEPVHSPTIEPVISPDLNFNISFVDALILMPKFGPSIKSLLTNKDKLCELARTSLNENCSAVLLKKLPEKLGDPGKFLIPCDFLGKTQCLALADLGASINLMPLSMWNKLSLSDLTPTCMTLELADRSNSHPVGVAEDVYVKVGSFHFLADFVVVDFDADPRVPLILRRSFLKTGRALIDVFE